MADPQKIRLLALDCARLISVTPTVAQQMADAHVLLPAMQRWGANSRVGKHMGKVFVLACGDAQSAHEAVDLAERLINFLLTGEVVPLVSGDR